MRTLNKHSLGLGAGMALAVALTSAAMISSTAQAATTGEPAPAFTAVDSQGVSHSLDDFKGKRVVLEWTNDGCPFVQKHYANPRKNMQTLQADAAADDIVWLSVISSAPGKQGHLSGDEADALNAERGAAPTAVLLDPSGDLGRLYSAKTTPHMYIIDNDDAQTLVYAGAIDSKSGTDPKEIDSATNYVTAALDNLEAGEPVDPSATKPYGCSIKFGS